MILAARGRGHVLLNILQGTGHSPTTKNDLTPNLRNTEVKKPTLTTAPSETALWGKHYSNPHPPVRKLRPEGVK